jgi:hypothetical protein
MKKITLIVAFIGMITLQSCSTSNDNNIDNDTISEVFEYSNVNFLPNDYSVLLTYPHSILSSDMVLVYRLSGSFQGEDIWKLLPETYYFDDGTLDLRYDFDFTRFDAELHLEGFDLAGVSNGYKLNQIFRVVVVPGYFGKNSKINFNDYKAVIYVLNINARKLIKIH